MKVGDRIELVYMPEDPDPIVPGSTGTVTQIVDTSFFQPGSTQVWVDWDNGRGLSLQIPPDRVRVIG